MIQSGVRDPSCDWCNSLSPDRACTRHGGAPRLNKLGEPEGPLSGTPTDITRADAVVLIVRDPERPQWATAHVRGREIPERDYTLRWSDNPLDWRFTKL